MQTDKLDRILQIRLLFFSFFFYMYINFFKPGTENFGTHNIESHLR